MTYPFEDLLKNILDEIVEDMKQKGIPVTSYQIFDDGGFDFIFSHGLDEETQAKAESIAQKHLNTTFHFKGN
jgi:hypothetical protein